MALLGSLIGKLIALAVLLVVLVGVAAGLAYATDAPVDATVTDKSCGQANTVTVVTKIGGITHTVEVDGQQCFIIQKGNFVQYHIRSERTLIYEKEGGSCLWDTKSGPGCPGA
jgi:hypothetical protein